jgi:hypothetical protein
VHLGVVPHSSNGKVRQVWVKVSEIDRHAYTEPTASAQTLSTPWEEFGLFAVAAGGSEMDGAVPYGQR